MARRLVFILLSSLSMIIGVMVSSSFAHAQSCKCEALVCDACEVQVGVDFYTESCDGGKTKSCQKPRCELPKNLAKGCEGRAGGIAGNDSSKGHDEASSKTENSPRIVESHRSAGVLVIARGSVTVISPMGKETEGKVGAQIFEKDVIVTGEESAAKIMMLDKNVLNVIASSRIKIRAFNQADAKGFSSSTVDLIYGKLRSQVVTKPRVADKPTFVIRTPAAVAGVRGTDFIVTHMKGGDISKVETLKGTVELSGHGRDQKTLVSKGQYASYVLVATKMDTKTFHDDDIATFAQKGFLTPVYRLTDLQSEKLNIETDFQQDGSDRIVAAASEAEAAKSLCSHPRADFNQCSWVCKGNPAGEKHCRTDLEGVQCVRRKCDAAGRWSADERLPAATGPMKCQGDEAVVAPCDY